MRIHRLDLVSLTFGVLLAGTTVLLGAWVFSGTIPSLGFLVATGCMALGLVGLAAVLGPRRDPAQPERSAPDLDGIDR